MGGRFAVDALPWVTAAAVLAAGLASRNCVLIAMTLVFSIHAFYTDMDKAGPWEGWRAAVRCWLAGAIGLIAALALAAMVMAAILDWWTPINDAPLLSLTVLLVAGASSGIASGSGPDCSKMNLLLVISVLLAAIATVAKLNGVGLAPCLFAALVSIVTGRIGWRLARHTGRELAMSEGGTI